MDNFNKNNHLLFTKFKITLKLLIVICCLQLSFKPHCFQVRQCHERVVWINDFTRWDTKPNSNLVICIPPYRPWHMGRAQEMTHKPFFEYFSSNFVNNYDDKLSNENKRVTTNKKNIAIKTSTTLREEIICKRNMCGRIFIFADLAQIRKISSAIK